MERMIIVDENDNVIGAKDRNGVGNEIYRVAALWLTDSSGKILLAQRSFKKKNSPGRWGPAVAGTVEEGETYESNITKEAKEEIGVTGIKFVPLKKIRVNQEYGKNYFCQYFKAVIDKPADEFIIQEDEVERVQWFEQKSLMEAINNNAENFVSSIFEILKL